MTTLLILPTQLFNHPKSFWNKYKQVIVYEEPYYLNKCMHGMKLWFHRCSMLEYFKSIVHANKKYIRYDESMTLPKNASMFHPIDKKMVKKYKQCDLLESPMFLMQRGDVDEYRSRALSQQSIYKALRIRYNILMNEDGTPSGGKWSFDESNRKRFPTDYKEPTIREYNSKTIQESRSIAELSIHSYPIHPRMIYPTTRRLALANLRDFISTKLKLFGPYQDAMRDSVIIGHHANISATLNVGLITPFDVLTELNKQKNIPIASSEGFVRQILGWREYIRVVYELHSSEVNQWNYLNANTKLPKSWYDGTTGYDTLDSCIVKVCKYAYAHHIERLMLLNNYGILFEVKYSDMIFWFRTLFIDGYDWVMVNTTMNVNSMSPGFRFMKRVYITNGNYLKKMGLKIKKEELEVLNKLYVKFLKKHRSKLKSDYVIASQLKRLG